jgi:hypothetical protein
VPQDSVLSLILYSGYKHIIARVEMAMCKIQYAQRQLSHS